MATPRPLSPAAARAMTVRAAMAHQAANPSTGLAVAEGSAYELMLAKLHADRRDLKNIQSVERKIEHKRKILPDYTAWIDGALSVSGQARQDDVLMSVLVWQIDVGDYAAALRIAAHALRHHLVLPDQYQRTLGTLLAEEFADAALRALTASQPVDVDALMQVRELVANEDMPDEVRAKLHKSIGLALEPTSAEDALAALREAYRLHDKCGVKKDIERLERATRSTQQDTAGQAGA